MAVDLQGADAVKPYAADKNFKTVVDTENVLSNHYGFKIVPNGIFIDEEGKIRLLKQGFKVDQHEHTSAVAQLIAKEAAEVQLDDAYYGSKASANLEEELAKTKFKLSLSYLQSGKKDYALKELDEAILLDGDNFLIRKQRWYIRHPEKFSPSIDIDWQQQQLEKERAEEAMLKGDSACGPEGCVIPGTPQAERFHKRVYPNQTRTRTRC